ncbi:hypothetical protein SI65_05966 [Aspergillus cristatus]|uniref:AB hydrolase-1 domain-containing protein n=1 Tax=Aspergillus cristatus TaxID=573508 RepID=A0A1E3BEM4_ASPCR|nr:hypothetical protein SI65_05966 [Aspergillus cristatus]
MPPAQDKLIGASGSLLVLIPVSNGTTLFYESLAPYLAPHFRVLLYDRRGYHRSRTDNRPSKEELYITHASDVAALIRHVSSSPAECDTEPAFVFTSFASSGVATELLLNHPHLVHAIVLHEPALTPLIPGALGVKIRQKGTDIVSKGQSEDLRGANAIINSLLYTDAELQLFKACPVFAQVPAVFKLADMVYYLVTEIPATRDYLPDLTRLKGEVGREETGVLARMPGEVLAGVLGVAVGLAPGGHVGYVTDAREFAEYLRRVLVGGEARL